MLDTQSGHRQHRNRRLKLAVSTSVLSKVGGALIQVVALPIAAHGLGPVQFGAYALIASTLNWLNMSSVGLGPALTKGVAESAAGGDQSRLKRLISSAFAVSICGTLVALCIVAILMAVVPITRILPHDLLPYAGQVQLGLQAMALLICVQIMLSPVDAARNGLQQQYVSNLFSLAANVASAALIAYVGFGRPSLIGIVLAANAPMLVARVGNAISLFSSQRDLRPSPKLVKRGLVALLLKDGIAFTATQLAVVLNTDYCVLIVGIVNGPVEAGVTAVLMQVVLTGISLASMVTNPLWPAVTDAHIRQDHHWLGNTVRKLRRFSWAVSVPAAALLTFAGPWAFIHLFNKGLHFTFLACAAGGLSLAICTWEHVNYMLLVGLGELRKATIAMLIRGLTVIPLAYLLARGFGSAGALFGMTLGAICVSAWYLPRLVNVRVLSQRTTKVKAGGAQTV